MSANPDIQAYLKPKISVLHVEDNRSDVAVVRGILDHIPSHEFKTSRVSSIAAAIFEANQHSYDVILLDLNLEDSEGISTIERMREAVPNSPIVITTSQESQLLVQSALRKGAQDYLFKGQLSKDVLNRAICNAIDRKIGDNSSHEKSMILSAIMENSEIGYWDWQIQNKHKYYSPTLKSMLGYADDEIDHNPAALHQLMHPDDLQYETNNFKQHVESHGRTPFKNESRYYHKDGSLVWIASRGKIIEWDKQDKPVRMVGCHIDISTLNKRHNHSNTR